MKHLSQRRAGSPADEILPATTRRGFLQLGLFGTATLALGSSVAAMTGCSSRPENMDGYLILRPQDREFLGALLPVIAAKSYPGPLGSEATERTLRSLDRLIFTVNEFSQKQLIQLFDLLSVAPLRVAAGAPWADWKDASPEEINDFLISWRDSSLQLKRMGYVSLSKLIGICWYAEPENYATVGYPGPPTKIPTPITEPAVPSGETN